MTSYNKSVLKPVFNMSKDQFVNVDKAVPLRKILGNVEKTARSTDYALVTDLKIGHEGDWSDVKRMMNKLHFQREEKGQLPENFKLETVDRPNSCKPGYFQITLPNKDAVINGETGNFLVLIPMDKKTVIMPQYYKFLENELDETEKRG